MMNFREMLELKIDNINLRLSHDENDSAEVQTTLRDLRSSFHDALMNLEYLESMESKGESKGVVFFIGCK